MVVQMGQDPSNVPDRRQQHRSQGPQDTVRRLEFGGGLEQVALHYPFLLGPIHEQN